MQGDKATADEAECGGGFWLHQRQRQAVLGGVELGRGRNALVTSSGEANNRRHPSFPHVLHSSRLGRQQGIVRKKEQPWSTVVELADGFGGTHLSVMA
nr:hypothetical protein Iba_chr15bCG8810 [Ipomoea batatas]